MLYFAGRGTSRRETLDDLWSGAGSRYRVRLRLRASELVFFFVCFSLVCVEDGRKAGFAALKPVAKGERGRADRGGGSLGTRDASPFQERGRGANRLEYKI